MAPQPGGGGLVILPHKSWNVWNQDNKSKVARDEKANAELIEAKEKCRKQTLQQIRFEKLNGKIITKQEEEDRIQYALDNMDISEYIQNDSMREIAKNINDKMQREEDDNKSSSNRKKRRMNEADFVDEESKKYLPRKRHKRNDVSIIEDHYNEKKKFEFDPNQYGAVHRRNHSDTVQAQVHKASNHSNSHFSLFDERDFKKKKDKEMINENERFQLGRTEIDGRKRSKKAWFLMTSQKEKERRNLMKADEIQRSLPRKFKEYECNTDKLKEKAMIRKHSLDPMEMMHRLMKIDKRNQHKWNDEEGEEDHHHRKHKKERKKKRKKSRSDRKKHRDHGDADYSKRRHKRKKGHHCKHKSSKKKRARS